MEPLRPHHLLITERQVADEALAKIGTMLEELGHRFDLVVEAVSGFGGKVDKLKEEIFGQFAEVGSQIRFLSDQIAENRSGLSSLRADFGAEMVRLGEAIGRTRVEFREQFASSEAALRGEIAAHALRAGEAAAEIHPVDGRAMAETMRELKREIAVSAEATAKKLTGEMAKTNKALANLGHKFERFDDRITVQVKDQDQRLKKVEGARRR
jgi:hypothetical protein